MQRARATVLVCQLVIAMQVAGLSTRLAPPAPNRAGTRSQLLELLRPSASVVPLTGKIADLADDLERQGMVPATPAFLALGLQGR